MRPINEQGGSIDIRILIDIHKFDRVCLIATEHAIDHAVYAADAGGIGERVGIILVQYLLFHDHTILR